MSKSAGWKAAGLLAMVAAGSGCGRKPAAIQLTPDKVVLYGPGRNQLVDGKVVDKKGRTIPDLALTWTSSDPSVVEVSPGGSLKSKAPGHAKVSAEYKGLRSSVSVRVLDLARLELSPSLLHLVGPSGTQARIDALGRTEAGGAAELPKLAWSSDKPSVATVSANGVVTALADGKAEITATTGDLIGASDIQVSIRKISRVELLPATVILKIGETANVSVVAYDDKGLPITDASAQFACSNPSVLKVGVDGSVTALARGTATVTASLGEHTGQMTVLID
jgi:uncharacterized protein YjdB